MLRKAASCAICLTVLTVAVAVRTAAATENTLSKELIQTSGLPEVGSGKFYGYRTPTDGPGVQAFSNALAKARAERVPLVVVWSNTGCGHCSTFAGELNEQIDEMSSWLSTNRAVFAFFKDQSGKYPPKAGHRYKACYDAYRFASEVCGAQPVWPLFAFYYVRDDGSVVTWGSPLDTVGGTRTVANFKRRFLQWVEENVVSGGAFAASATALDRYEAESTTQEVEVDFVRDARNSGDAVTNLLVASWGGINLTNTVEWKSGDSGASSGVDVRPFIDGKIGDGDKILLTLADVDGTAIATNAIYFVDRKNGAGNPLWKRERTKDTLQFGEWTVDIDAATNKVAAFDGNAYTLVGLLGSLWCPDCSNTDSNFLELTDANGNNIFREWARSNNIALVSVDIPNYNGPSITNFTGTSIFSRDTYTVASTGEKRSGRGYLTRKMVSSAEAATARERSHFLVSANTDQGGFHRPEDSNPNRTGVPVFAVLRKDGTVAGRVTRFAYSSPKETDRSKHGFYLRRFMEIIEQDRLSADSAFEMANNHFSETAMELDSSHSVTGALCHADTRDNIRLTDVSAGALVKLSLSGEDVRNATLSVLSVSNGVSSVLASTNGPLSGLSVSVELDRSEGWFAMVSCNDAGAGFQVDSETSTVVNYSISEDFILVPQEFTAKNRPARPHVVFRVESGMLYRITGIAPTEGLVREGLEGDVYRSEITGDLRAPLADGSVEVEYQVWKPGEIAFVSDVERVIEYAGTGFVHVVRRDGGSGAASVVVRRAAVQGDAMQQGRIEWIDTEVSWADGESGVKEVAFPIVSNEIPEGDATLSLSIEKVEGCMADVPEGTTCTITVVDTDAPCFERLNYVVQSTANIITAAGFRLINVKDTDVGVSLSRVAGSGALPSGLKLSYDATAGVVTLSGVPVKPGTYEFVCSVSARRDGKKVSGFETTLRIEVEDASDANPMIMKSRPTQRLHLFHVDGGGKRFLAGYVNFAATSKGRLSARYQGTEGRSLSFAGNWKLVDADGRVSAKLTAKGAEMDAVMDADGSLSVELGLPDGYSCFTDGVFRATAGWPKSADFSPYRGRYTVALPQVETDAAVSHPAGPAVLLLNMSSSSAVRNGTVAFAGTLPDGTSVSGSSKIEPPTGDVIEVPVFVRTARNVFGADLSVGADGASKWDSDGVSETTGLLERQLVTGMDGVAAYTFHRERSFEWFSEHEMYGSYFEQSVSPKTLDELFYSDEGRFAADAPYTISFNASSAAESERHGTFLVEPGVLRAASRKFSLDRQSGAYFSSSATTGAFNGRARMRFEDGKVVTGQYKGVLTPGWVLPCACGIVAPEHPMGLGVFFFRDMVDGVTVTRSIAVEISKSE